MFLAAFGIVVPVVILGLIVMGIGAATSRREPDPAGRRLAVVYLVSMTFVTLFIVLFAGFTVISSALKVPFDSGSGGSCVSSGFGTECRAPSQSGNLSFVDLGPSARDADIRALVGALVVALAAALVLVPHWRRLRSLVADPGFGDHAGFRTYLSHLYLVCFVTLLTAVVAGAGALYALFELIAPGVAASSRHAGLEQLIALGLLAATALVIFRGYVGEARRLGSPGATGESAV